MNVSNQSRLNQNLNVGAVYRRGELTNLSTAIDRDLANLVEEGLIEKVAPGLYYKPKKSRFGVLPPDNNLLVKSFLRDDYFLIYSWNDYNKLGLGLTQLYNRMTVYNRKRHGVFKLNNQEFDFRRPARGFPEKITPEFLLVDIVNNLKELDENPNLIKQNIKKFISNFNKDAVVRYAKLYGKISTLKFFEQIYR